MGKKNLIKSTTKKKTSSPKKSASKQSATSAKTTKPAEKKVAKAKKPASSAAPPKQARKEMSVNELLKLSFETWSPDKLYAPPADASGPADYTAPPFFDATPEEKTALKSLLAMQFDLTAPPVAPETPSPAAEEKPAAADKEIKTAEEIPEAAAADETPAVTEDTAPDNVAIAEIAAPDPASPAESKPAPEPPRKAVPVGELLKLSFGTWSPDKLYAPPAAASGPANYTAPPFFDGTPEEAKTVKTLLSRKFDLNAPPDAPETPAEEAQPAADEIPETPEPEEETTQVETATPEKSEAISEPVPPIEAPKTQEPTTAASEAPTEPESASETKPDIPPARPVCAEPPIDKDPPNTALRMLIGCLAVIFGLLLIASAMNSSNYYLKPTPAGLEIWRGKFSPKGKVLVETVPNVALSAPVESVYNRDQAMTVVFEYCMNQATRRSTVIGEPDFNAIAGLYEQAKKYATTPAQADLADTRLKTIKTQSLISAADKAVIKMTPRNIDKALALLNEAAGLATDRTQQQLIRVKIDELTAMKTKKAEKETGAKPAVRKETTAAGKSKD